MSNLSRGIGRIIGFQRLTWKKKSHHKPSSSSSFSTSTSSSSTTSSPSMLRNPLQWYVSKLDTHPLTTKIITSGLISGSGDLLCQYLTAKQSSNDDDESSNNSDMEKYEKPFNWMRTLRFTILGSFLVAPTVHVWYGFLMSSIPGSGVMAIAKRLFCDQGLFAPLFLPTFLSCLTILEHVTPDYGSDRNDNDNNNTHMMGDSSDNNNNSDLFSRITTRLRNDVPDALVVGWSMWIPSMGFMFAVIPGKFQVLFSNGVGFVWNAYLSWRTHEGEEADGG